MLKQLIHPFVNELITIKQQAYYNYKQCYNNKQGYNNKQCYNKKRVHGVFMHGSLSVCQCLSSRLLRACVRVYEYVISTYLVLLHAVLICISEPAVKTMSNS